MTTPSDYLSIPSDVAMEMTAEIEHARDILKSLNIEGALRYDERAAVARCLASLNRALKLIEDNLGV